jgi:hypothetical protein
MILFPTTQKIAFSDGLNSANTGSTSGSCLNSSDSKIYFVDGLNSTDQDQLSLLV